MSEENVTEESVDSILDGLDVGALEESVYGPTDSEEALTQDSEIEEQPEDDALEDTDEVNDEEVEDQPEDDTEETTEDDADEDKEVWEFNDLELDQEIRMTDGSVTTLKELEEGRLMQSDYTKKTQALAEERKEFEGTRDRAENMAEQVLSEHANIEQQWEQELHEASEAYRMNPADPSLQARYNTATATLTAAKQQTQATNSKYQEVKTERINAQIDDAASYAIENIPGWNEQYANDIVTYAKETHGIDEAALMEIMSGPALAIIDKAMKFDKGSKKATEKRSLAKKQGKSLRASNPSGKKATKQSAASKKNDTAMERYEKTGDFNELNDLLGDDFERSVFGDNH